MILQTEIPYEITAGARLPGTRPLGDAPWLIADEAFAAQMAERERLLATRRDVVIAEDPAARPAVLEMLDTVLEALPPGFARQGAEVVRPDGVTVGIDRDDPLATLTLLVQEDFVLMEKRGGDEHMLTAATLCFPAQWRLSEKFMRPLTTIHEPVPHYDEGVARRVQRLFDGLQDGRPIWRYNTLRHRDGRLHQPDRPDYPKWTDTEAAFFRTERQVLLRLPVSRAVVFSIHTYVLASEDAPGLGN
ncbi:Protein of unknown function [Roseivivax lentus]|uniref:DUF3445 domain-containing protein n=1 Tax=Roseivivax lentus TaxID=633194 RepID=A0A1N7MZH7_9RHOB|nr:DUF3445 domain-containing protein [Roseivivax lentus]SIS91533.1 Protein of unknown function [Roseivivax lentus]